ncbi:MAG TPA: glycosyltransferase family 1 protein [Acidobacteria bacterium]|nr:glycosyltransferase family 1 protein [Acidobacteriota bacterium]
MRIAVDGKALVGPAGGVARYVEGLLAGIESLAPERFSIELLRPGKNGSTLLWTLWNLQRASGEGFHVLHCPFYYTPLAPRCPVTVAIHDVLPLEHPEWFARSTLSPIRHLMPITARRANAVVTDAECIAQAIEELCHVPRQNIRVIPHAVDHEQFHLQPMAVSTEARRRWAGGHPYLLQGGALEPRRGIDLSLVAMMELRRRRPELVLVLVGGGRAPVPELDAPPPWVVRPGFVPDEELPALYAGAEAVLSPSRGEGFDLPLLEALACGAAVVASDIPVHVEHFGPAVELFASGDAEDLAGAVETVLSDSERARELREAAPRLAARFTWERSAAAHLELWREIAGR